MAYQNFTSTNFQPVETFFNVKKMASQQLYRPPHDVEDSAVDSDLAVERIYQEIMARNNEFKHNTPPQLIGSGSGVPDTEAHTDVKRSDSIRNLLEAMNTLGINIDDLRNYPPEPPASQPPILNKETEPHEMNDEDYLKLFGLSGKLSFLGNFQPDHTSTRHARFPREALPANEIESTESNHLNRNISTMQSACELDVCRSRKRDYFPQDSSISANIYSKSIPKEQSEKSQMVFETIQKSLIEKLQATGSMDEKSLRAMKTTAHDFSQWVGELLTENEKRQNFKTGSTLNLRQGSNENHCEDDVVKINEISEEEIRRKLGGSLNDSSNQVLFNSESANSDPKVVVHVLKNSNSKEMIIRKKTEDAQWKNWILEISPDATLKTTLTSNLGDMKEVFALQIKTSSSSYLLTL